MNIDMNMRMVSDRTEALLAAAIGTVESGACL